MTSDDASALPLATRRDTRRLARALAGALLPGDAVVLTGSLGAGKTFLVRALCRALGLHTSVRVVSPTFTLIRELPTQPPIAHADLYRLVDPEQTRELGLLELRDRGRVLLVEWGEQHAEALGPDRLSLSILLGPRRVSLHADGPRSELLRRTVLEALRGARPPTTTPPPAPGSP